jgi:actin-related protein
MSPANRKRKLRSRTAGKDSKDENVQEQDVTEEKVHKEAQEKAEKEATKRAEREAEEKVQKEAEDEAQKKAKEKEEEEEFDCFNPGLVLEAVFSSQNLAPNDNRKTVPLNRPRMPRSVVKEVAALRRFSLDDVSNNGNGDGSGAAAVERLRAVVVQQGVGSRKDPPRPPLPSRRFDITEKTIRPPRMAEEVTDFQAGKTSFHCALCEHTAKRCNNLARHVLAVHQTTPNGQVRSKEIVVKIFNGFNLFNISNLNRVFHCNSFSQVCCEKNFASRVQMLNHVRVHHRQGPSESYSCSKCEKAFAMTTLLHRHEQHVHQRIQEKMM